MKKNLSIFYVAPQIEECTYADDSVLCASGDIPGSSEAFTEEEDYVW